MNTKAIADAIAGRFTGITATVGSVTESLASTPTASLPNTLGKGPVVLVFHPSGALEIGVSAMRTDLYTFPVKLLRDPVDYPSRSDWLYAWYDAMHDRVALDMDLGLPSYVDIAEAGAVRIELDGESYAGIPYDVVELTVTVRIYEHATIGV